MRPSETSRTKTPLHDDMHLWLYYKKHQRDLIQFLLDKKRETDLFWQYVKKYSDYLMARDDKGFQYTENRKSVQREDRSVSVYNIETKREIPIFSGFNNKFLSGVCDAIITYNMLLRRTIKLYDFDTKKTEKDKLGAMIKIENKSFYVDYKKRAEEQIEAIPLCDVCIKNLNIIEIDRDSVRHDHRKRGVIIDFKPTIDSISGVMGQLKTYKTLLSDSNTNFDLMILTFDTNDKYDPLLEKEGIYIFRLDANMCLQKPTNEEQPSENLEDLFWARPFERRIK